MSIKKVLVSCSSFLLSCMISMSAMGDDLEIYLGTSDASVEYFPNVLFIMDTSGSMDAYDGTGESRMLRVKNALKETLGSVTNVNAGLMRFSDFGGPILYPVRPIDNPVLPELVTPVISGDDDAYEIDGVVNNSSSSVKISNGTDTVTSGFRFQNLMIPQGAEITKAYIRFSSSQLNTSATSIKIRGELSSNSASFTTTNNDLSSRTPTASELVWEEDNDWPLSGDSVASPSIINVLQEVIDQNGWCGGNSLSILMEGTSVSSSSDRRTNSYNNGSGLTPQLIVSYDDSTATGCVGGEQTYQVAAQSDNAEEKSNGYQSTGTELTMRSSSNSYIGIRFRNLAVPKDAVITEAHIEFTAYSNRTGSGASFNIRGLNQANPGNFNSYPRYKLRNAPKTAAVPWANIPKWYKNYDYQTPDVSSIVTQLVTRGDWESGNDMIFVLSDFTGFRGAYTYNGKPSGAARLVVKFQGAATPGTTSTVRQHLIGKVDELSENGFTPIVDTLYEATNYFGGRDVDYGLTRGTSSVSSSVRRSTRVSHRLSYIGSDAVRPNGCTEDDLNSYACRGEYIPSGANYISPIEDRQCQTNNHIVLLSDGVANNNHSVSKIEALLSKSCSGSGGEKCGVDLVSNIGDTGDSAIDARIVTHTIGFAANSTASNFLNRLAIAGGGGFYEASSSSELVTAFSSILKTVKDVNATFVSPGVAVNQLNRLTHNNELYFALFKPAEGTIWPGNLKKYKIDGETILDKNGLKAVDEGTGFFSENSHSYWSVLQDGNDVREGGAASRVSLSRNMYAFDGTGVIAKEANRLHESNTSITTSDMAIDNLPDANVVREDVLKWVRGVDVRDEDGDGDTDDIRFQMGDPIHSQPIIVNYSATQSAILVATNHGLLHSIDPTTGSENFAVMPKELLNNQYDLYRDGSTLSHIYGLDGDMVLRDEGDKKYLYVGMRRGGRNYYAFDISSKDSPSLLFKIEGGVTAGFEKLGQTWSRPTFTKIKIGGTSKQVLIFGGGYDEEQDDKTLRSTDNVGNAVYIVDADDGSLLWSASNSGSDLNISAMQYSVPARVSVVDREGDGFADHLYVVDMGGQMFRLDIIQGESGSDLVIGGLMASFGGDAEVDNRRFFYGPDVSEISLANEHYYAVAVGSGFRAHPLDSVIQDEFYMIKDDGVFNLNEAGNYSLPSTVITQSSLYDASLHKLTSTDETEQEIEAASFAQKQGWYISLGSGGEKVLASPLIIDYQLFFTTYLPASASTSACAPPSGNSRAYLVNLVNANAVTDLDRDGTLEHQDRFAQLRQTGIAPETKILIEDIIKPVVCLGTECTSAVIDLDDEGNPEDCGTAFECLAENIYGRFERVQKSSWKTEVERQ